MQTKKYYASRKIKELNVNLTTEQKMAINLNLEVKNSNQRRMVL